MFITHLLKYHMTMIVVAQNCRHIRCLHKQDIEMLTFLYAVVLNLSLITILIYVKQGNNGIKPVPGAPVSFVTELVDIILDELKTTRRQRNSKFTIL